VFSLSCILNQLNWTSQSKVRIVLSGIPLKPWFRVCPSRRPSFWCISELTTLLSLKFWYVLLWYVFSTMPQVWPKFYLPSKSYGSVPKTYWFLAFSREWTCIECHVSNILDMILKFIPEILWGVIFPLKLVALNLDPHWRRYDYFTQNTCLILVIGLVK
jgi:hypothetical protein